MKRPKDQTEKYKQKKKMEEKTVQTINFIYYNYLAVTLYVPFLVIIHVVLPYDICMKFSQGSYKCTIHNGVLLLVITSTGRQ